MPPQAPIFRSSSSWRLLIFGFRTNPPPLEEFKESEICKLWEKCECPHVGSLYVHNTTGTSLFLNGGFIEDRAAHRRFVGDGLINLTLPSEYCFIVSLETWRTVEKVIWKNWMDVIERPEGPKIYCVPFDIVSERKEWSRHESLCH